MDDDRRVEAQDISSVEATRRAEQRLGLSPTAGAPRRDPVKEIFARDDRGPGQAKVPGVPGDADKISPDLPATGPVNAIEFTLPGVGRVEIGPPLVATQFLIARILGEQPTTDKAVAGVYLKYLMWLRVIDGQPISRPTNFTEAQILATRLTDSGLEFVGQLINQYWPSVSPESLALIKK